MKAGFSLVYVRQKLYDFGKVAKRLKAILPILALTLIPTFLIWIPFILRLKSFWTIPLSQSGMGTIVANYDGPLYLVIAKSFYNMDFIQANYSFPLPVEYYAAHFPLLPLLIRIFSFVAGYPYSMLFVTLASSFLAIYFFNIFIKEFVEEKSALLATFAFSIFPARWLITRSVGSAEPLFIAGTLASVYYFRRKKYWKAGIWGAVAALTKPPGILLFVAYAFAIATRQMKKLFTGTFKKWVGSLRFNKVYPILLIPLSLIVVFVIYSFTFNDFFAYFKSGDNIHLFFPPFQIFNYSQPWVGTFWLEEVLFVYVFILLGLIKLIQRKETTLAWFVGIFFLSIIFISHRDIVRYALPILPFLYAAYAETLTKNEFKILIIFLIIPIYLFSLAYISQNVMPISNWAPLL